METAKTTSLAACILLLIGSALASCAGETETEADQLFLADSASSPVSEAKSPADPSKASDEASAKIALADAEEADKGETKAKAESSALKAPKDAKVTGPGVPSGFGVDPKTGAVVEDIWKPAATPRGGVSWSTLEATKELTRLDDEGYIISKPQFTAAVKKLEGKRVKVAGWMSPIDSAATQSHFLLLGYPPGCPFHFHAAPNQFIEIYAEKPFPTNETKVFVVTGVLELTGYDESGIFYRIRNAKQA